MFQKLESLFKRIAADIEWYWYDFRNWLRPQKLKPCTPVECGNWRTANLDATPVVLDPADHDVCWAYLREGATVHIRHTPHAGIPCRTAPDETVEAYL
jgi:hypothetical protein